MSGIQSDEIKADRSAFAGRDASARSETTVNMAGNNDQDDLRVSSAVLAVKLDNIDAQFRTFANEIVALREMVSKVRDAQVDSAHRQERTCEETHELKLRVDKIDLALNGNGKLGTRQWERITRGLTTVLMVLVVGLMMLLFLQSLQTQQIQVQISHMADQIQANSEQIGVILQRLAEFTAGVTP